MDCCVKILSAQFLCNKVLAKLMFRDTLVLKSKYMAGPRSTMLCLAPVNGLQALSKKQSRFHKSLLLPLLS